MKFATGGARVDIFQCRTKYIGLIPTLEFIISCLSKYYIFSQRLLTGLSLGDFVTPLRDKSTLDVKK